jgi:hypothetical protein
VCRKGERQRERKREREKDRKREFTRPALDLANSETLAMAGRCVRSK